MGVSDAQLEGKMKLLEAERQQRMQVLHIIVMEQAHLLVDTHTHTHMHRQTHTHTHTHTHTTQMHTHTDTHLKYACACN